MVLLVTNACWKTKIVPFSSTLLLSSIQVEKIYIVGVGDEGVSGISQNARELVQNAEIVIGSGESLSGLDSTNQQIESEDDLEKVVDLIESNQEKRVVVLTSGDPLFYGTTRFLCDRIGKDRFEILPHVSIMQLAFARVKESWDEAFLTDLSSKRIDQVIDRIRTAQKVGIFTSSVSSPRTIAQTLVDHQITYFTAYVCENIGSPYETVTKAELNEIARQDFSSLNVMILVRKEGAPDQPPGTQMYRLFGNPDELFLQSKPKRGLLTPAEVRSLALSEMHLTENSVVWDVGAGSGSLSLEAARIVSQGSVFAIEMDIDDFNLLIENAKRFAISNVSPIHGKAPDAWEMLPDPDAIFIGGTGRSLLPIVDSALPRLKPGGHLVVHVSNIENLVEVREVMKKHQAQANFWMLNFARGNLQMEALTFESVNPTFLISACVSSGIRQNP